MAWTCAAASSAWTHSRAGPRLPHRSPPVAATICWLSRVNQNKAHAEVKRWFEANAFSVHGSLYPCFDAFDEGHGRLVRRRVFACTELEPLAALQRWPCLTAVLATENIRSI